LKVAIINYNVGNLASVYNACKKIGYEAVIEDNPKKLKKYDKIILPGVGAFGDAMAHLSEVGFDEAIKEFAKSGKYMIGICLGMQLLFNKSYEFGEFNGLGLIDGEVVEFDRTHLSKENHKIPHVGWNKMFIQKKDRIFDKISDPYLYFVHSFHAKTDEDYIIGKTFYGYEFVSAVNKDNIYGFQPHPEKSHEVGLKILKNFMELK